MMAAKNRTTFPNLPLSQAKDMRNADLVINGTFT
jgi:hypothetical protein